MGTRADFYVGRGPAAEWVGSVAYDGDPDNYPAIMALTTEETYRAAVLKELSSRDDATLPAQGWPWPWEDSSTSDYAIAFDAGGVFYSACQRGTADDVWVKLDTPQDDDGYPIGADLMPCVFPNMLDRQNVTLGPRSGVMLCTGLKKGTP